MQAMPPDDSLAVRALIAAETGLQFDTSGLVRLHGGIRRRMTELSCALPADYLTVLRGPRGATELASLIDLITVPETRFFRDERQFALLADHVLPTLARARRHAGAPASLRLWSAACASGEEAWSLAIAALEALPGWHIQVLGTDISARSLALAERGIYAERRLENLDPTLRARYFETTDEGLRAGNALRATVRFLQANLTADDLAWRVGDIQDVIFCENVLIYLEREAILRLAASLARVLREDGYLFLSASESLWRTTTQFVLETHEGVFVHRKARPGESPQRAAPAAPRAAPVPAALRPAQTATLVAAAPSDSPVRAPAPGPATAVVAATAAGHAAPPAGAAAPPAEAVAPPAAPEPGAAWREASRLADRGDLAAAQQAVARGLAAAPLDAALHALHGTLCARQGATAAAVLALERAVYLDPTAPLAYYQLADAYRQAGQGEQARRAYRHALHLLARLPTGQLVGGVSAALLARTCRHYLQAR